MLASGSGFVMNRNASLTILILRVLQSSNSGKVVHAGSRDREVRPARSQAPCDSIHLCGLPCITKNVHTQYFRHARRKGWQSADFVSGYSSPVFLPERLARCCCDLSSERSCHTVARHDQECVLTEFGAVRCRSSTRPTGQRSHPRFRAKRRCVTGGLFLFDGTA